MVLRSIKINQYVNGFIATGYDRTGLSIMDGESKPNQEDAVNSLLAALNETEGTFNDEGAPIFRELTEQDAQELNALLSIDDAI